MHWGVPLKTLFVDRFWAVVFSAVVFFGGLGAAQAGLSPIRLPAAPADLYLRAAQKAAIANTRLTDRGQVVFVKGKFADADWKRVPTVTDEDLQISFELARDATPFDDTNPLRTKLRRATWLYPDDGCFVRAVVAADVIEQSLSVSSAKIFAFGNLDMKSPYSAGGSVSWWYHVAAIAKVSSKTGDRFYVYDPAMQQKKPMEVRDWLKAMNSPDAEIAVCSGDAYDPDSDCASGEPKPYARAKAEAPAYLFSEWERLERLGHDPLRELGDFPPWR